MAEYRKAPKPPLGRRIVEGVKNHLGTSIAGFIVGVAVLVFGIVFLGQGGSGSGPSTTVVQDQGAPAAATQPEPEPESAVQEVAQRPYWINAPETFEEADAEDDRPAINDYPLDFIVGRAKHIYESPEGFAGKSFFVVGKVLSQQPVPGKFFDREFRMVSGEPGFDVYVGLDQSELPPTDGQVVVVFGRLAAVGETRAPGLPPENSVYMLGKDRPYSGAVEPALIFETGSHAIHVEIKRVKEATAG